MREKRNPRERELLLSNRQSQISTKREDPKHSKSQAGGETGGEPEGTQIL